MFAAYPIAFALVLVFLQWDLVTAPSLAGLDNVRLLANDGRFWRAVANTFVFLSIHVPLQIVDRAGARPGAQPPTRAAHLLARRVLSARRDLGRGGRDPVEQPLRDRRRPDQPVAGPNRIVAGAVAHRSTTAMPAIAAMVTWKNVGFYVIIYLAGLQYIPRSCQEAIEIEGASSWQRFRFLTLPMLLPQTILVITLSTINGFQLFIEPYVMTGGGPLRRTYSIVLYLYTNAFSYQKMGYAATIGVALALIIGAVVLIQRPIDRQGGGAVKALRRVGLYAVLTLAALTFIYPFSGWYPAPSSLRSKSARWR